MSRVGLCGVLQAHAARHAGFDKLDVSPQGVVDTGHLAVDRGGRMLSMRPVKQVLRFPSAVVELVAVMTKTDAIVLIWIVRGGQLMRRRNVERVINTGVGSGPTTGASTPIEVIPATMAFQHVTRQARVRQ